MKTKKKRFGRALEGCIITLYYDISCFIASHRKNFENE